MLVASQAFAQRSLSAPSVASEDPPNTFSDDHPPLEKNSRIFSDDHPLLEKKLGEEIPPGLETKASESKADEAGLLDGEMGLLEVEDEEELIFDGNYWNVVSSGDWLNSGRWYAQADLVMLNRSNSQQLNLSNQAFGTTSFQLIGLAMTTDSSGFGYEPGTRLTLGTFLGRDAKNRDHSIEFSFFGMPEWSTGYSVSGSGGTYLMSSLDNNVPGFNFSDTQSFSYQSNFNSYEMNVRVRSRLGKDRLVHKPNGVWQRESNEGRMTSFFGGMRLIAIDEEFLFSAQGNGVANFSPNPNSGSYLIEANNDMFGVQLGLEIYEQTYNWSYGLRGKIGGLVNFADQRSVVEVVDIDNPGPNFNRAANDEQLTLLLELSIAATYQLRPNMSLRFSYDFLYLQGLAHAPEQLNFNFNDQTRINTGSFTLFDGASFGFEAVW